MRRIFDSKRNNLKMLFETKGIGFRKDGKLWVGSAAKSNKSDDSISKSNLILVLPTNAQIIAAGLNPSDAQFGQLVTFSDILTKLGLFTKRTTTKEITVTPSTIKDVKEYTDLFISYFKKFPEDIDIKIPRFFIKNNVTTIQFNIRTPLSYVMDFSKGSGVENNWSDFTNEAKLSANLVSCYEYIYEKLSKNVKKTHASVSKRVGLVGGNLRRRSS